jgi:hypothetical protein
MTSSSYCCILVVLPFKHIILLSKTTPAHVQRLCVLHSQPARTRFTSIRRSSVIFDQSPDIRLSPLSDGPSPSHSILKKCHVNFLSHTNGRSTLKRFTPKRTVIALHSFEHRPIEPTTTHTHTHKNNESTAGTKSTCGMGSGLGRELLTLLFSRRFHRRICLDSADAGRTGSAGRACFDVRHRSTKQ